MPLTSEYMLVTSCACEAGIENSFIMAGSAVLMTVDTRAVIIAPSTKTMNTPLAFTLVSMRGNPFNW
jgi:hypothetical protein